MERILAIDALRGLAIILMLTQHAPLFLMKDAETTDLYALALMISRFSAPLFFMLVGYSITLSAKKRIPLGGKPGFLRHIAYRSLSIFMLGYLINILRMDEFFALNVIHLIGFSVLACGLLYLSGSKTAYTTTLMVLLAYCFLTPHVRSQITINSPINFIAWFMTTGEAPISAWIIYFVIGLGVGWHSKQMQPQPRMLFTGYCLMILSIILIFVGYLPDFISNTPPLLFYMLGSVAIIYHITVGLSRWKYTAPAAKTLAAYGRHSLAIYAAHQFLFIFIPGIAGLQNTLSAAGVTLVFLVFLVAAYLTINKYDSKISYITDDINQKT